MPVSVMTFMVGKPFVNHSIINIFYHNIFTLSISNIKLLLILTSKSNYFRVFAKKHKNRAYFSEKDFFILQMCDIILKYNFLKGEHNYEKFL